MVIKVHKHFIEDIFYKWAPALSKCLRHVLLANWEIDSFLYNYKLFFFNIHF